MSGITRRQMLKASAAAGGLAWAAPLLSTTAAWGSSAGCAACEGGLYYAKFAPGNAQTDNNQCLQPGTIPTVSTDCLEDALILGACDDVNSNSNWATIRLGKGAYPMRLSMQVSGNCYIARCEENFGQVYTWTASTNVTESYVQANHYDDPATAAYDPMFQIFRSTSAATPGAIEACTGNQSGPQTPANSAVCETSRNSVGPSSASPNTATTCPNPVTGVMLSAVALRALIHNGNTLNFIEMELCIPNISTLNC